MKANELRIGNLYHFADNDGVRYRKVSEIKHNEFGFECDYDGVNFGICRPVPLTEGWLLNFGFEYSKFYNNYFVKAGDYFNSISYDVEDCEWNYNNDKSDAACYYVTSIKYVHQLQNLYFALTGEELQYESK
jgi:hypothetical protein